MVEEGQTSDRECRALGATVVFPFGRQDLETGDGEGRGPRTERVEVVVGDVSPFPIQPIYTNQLKVKDITDNNNESYFRDSEASELTFPR